MKLNIKLLLCLNIIFISKILADAPAWVLQVDSIIAGLDDLATQLENDVTLYVNLEKSLNLSLDTLTKIDAERQKLIQVVHDKIKQLNDQIAQQQTDSQNQLAQKDVIIADLQKSLADLKTQTEQEIAALNQQIAQLNIDLAAAKQAYTDLLAADSQKTPEVVAKLAAARDNYSKMVDARTNFLAAIDKLATAINTHAAAEKADIESLGVELAGQDFLAN